MEVNEWIWAGKGVAERTNNKNLVNNEISEVRGGK